MKFFIDYSAKVSEDMQTFRVFPAYLEIESQIKNPVTGIKTFFYIHKVSPTSAFLMGCWGHELDAWMALLEDETAGKHWWSVFQKTYPTLSVLIGDPAKNTLFTVTKLLDPDDGEQKWVIGLIVEKLNMSFKTEADYKNLVASKGIQEAYTALTKLSFTSLVELRTKSISSLDKVKVQGKTFIETHPEEVDLLKQVFEAFIDTLKSAR